MLNAKPTVVQGSRSGTWLVLLLLFLVALCGCGQNKAELTEAWESQKRRAFQEFRDRRYDAAIVTYNKALDAAAKIDPEGLEIASTLNEMAVVYATQGKEKEAGESYERANTVLERLTNIDNLNREINRVYADTLEGLGKLKEKSGDLPGAEQLYARGVEVAGRCDVPTKLRELVYEYKSLLQQEGKDEEAKALGERFAALSEEKSARLPDRENYLHEEAQKSLRAVDQAMKAGDRQKVHEAYESAYGYARQSHDARFRGDIEGRTAMYLYGIRNLPAAEAAIGAAIRDWRDAGVDDKKMHPYLITYSAIEHELGNHESSARSAALAMKIAEKNFGADSVEMQQSLSAVVNSYIGQRRYSDALPLFERSYELAKKHAPLTSPPVIMHTCWLSNVYWLDGKQSKTEALLASYTRDCLKSRQNLLLVGRLFVDFGDEMKHEGNRPEARVFYNTAIKVLKQTPENDVEMKRAQKGLAAAQ